MTDHNITDAPQACGFHRFHGDRTRLIDWSNHLDHGEFTAKWSGSGWNIDPLPNDPASRRSVALLIERAKGFGFDAYLQDDNPAMGGVILSLEKSGRLIEWFCVVVGGCLLRVGVDLSNNVYR